MADPGITAIRIVHGDTTFHVHGDQAGAEGVWLAEGQVEGLYDAPVKTTWKSGAFQDGSRQKHRKWLHRDLELGFHVIETISTTYEFNESSFRRMFDYELDPWEVVPTVTTIEVETTISGTRKLDVLMYEAPTFAPKLDPIMNQYGNLIMHLRAGQPFWYESDDTDTGWHESTDGTVYNPTDQIMYHKWILPVGSHTLPDVSWEGSPGARAPGGAFSTRTISVDVTSENGGAVVDLDRQELMFRDVNNTNILAQLAGKVFAFPIPPYTQSQTLPGLSSTGVLVMPRYWSRPWGLGLDEDS